MAVIERETDLSRNPAESGAAAAAARLRLLPRRGIGGATILFLALLAIGVLPLAAQALWTSELLWRTAGSEEEAVQTALARGVAARLEKFGAVASGVLHASDASLRGNGGGAGRDALAPLLASGGIRFVSLLAPGGHVRACLSAPAEACPTALPGLVDLPGLAPRAFTPGGAPFTMPADDRTAAGHLLLVRPAVQASADPSATVALLSLDPVAAIAEAGGRAQTQLVTVLDRDGRVLYHEDPALRLSAPPLRPGLGAAAAAGGRGQITDPADGQVYPASIAEVPGLGWTVAVHRRDTGLAALGGQVWAATAAIAALVAALAAILAAWMSRSARRAIRHLVDATTAVRSMSRRLQEDRGDLQAPRPEDLAARAGRHPSREVRLLATSIAAMAAAVRTRQERDSEQVRAARGSNEKKSAFVANISHQLRTPLNSIIGFSEMMTDQLFGPLGNPKYLEYAHSVHDSGEYLMRILNDVRDLSRAEIGVLDLDETTLDVGRLLRSSVSIVSREACARDVKLELVPAEEMPVVRGDEQRLQQALINLINHAVNASPDGARVEIAAALAANGELYVRIRDSGRPIADDDLAKLLTPFDEVQRSYDRRFEGAGLGLPLARTMLELHGGRLDIQSLPDRGNALSAILPASRVLRQTAA